VGVNYRRSGADFDLAGGSFLRHFFKMGIVKFCRKTPVFGWVFEGLCLIIINSVNFLRLTGRPLSAIISDYDGMQGYNVEPSMTSRKPNRKMAFFNYLRSAGMIIVFQQNWGNLDLVYVGDSAPRGCTGDEGRPLGVGFSYLHRFGYALHKELPIVIISKCLIL
jgi:hypothetical protein